jgi:hypothetical protein
MRKVFALAALTGLAGCGTPSHWEKPGADLEATRADVRDCRRLASQEAFRQQAFDVGFARYGSPWWGYPHRPSYAVFRSRLDTDRFYSDHRLTNFCMRSKGYELVPDEPPSG